MTIILEDKYKKDVDFNVMNENIDHNLLIISSYPRGSFLISFIDLKYSDKLPHNPKDSVIDFMTIEGLIEHPNKHMVNLTKLGYEVVRNGGWIKHIEREKDKTDKIDKKLEYELNISRIKSNTLVPVMVLGAFGGIYSIIKVGVFLLGLVLPTKQMQETSSQKKANKSSKITKTEHHKYFDYNHQDSLKTYSLSNSEQLTKEQKKRVQ